MYLLRDLKGRVMHLLIPFPLMVLENLQVAASRVAGRFLHMEHAIVGALKYKLKHHYSPSKNSTPHKPRDDDNVLARLCKNIL